MTSFTTEDLDTFLASTVTGGAPITPMEFLTGLIGKAEASPSYPPYPAFVYHTSDVAALLPTNNKYQGVLYPNGDGTVQLALNISSFLPVIVQAIVDLNADYQAYKIAHP